MSSRISLRMSKFGLCARTSKRVRTTVRGLVLASVVSSTTTAFAVVVFDPGMYAENLRQVLAVLDQIDRATTQLENQWRMLRRLPISVGRSLGVSGRRLYDRLTPTFRESAVVLPVLHEQTQRRLPTGFSGDEVGWLESERGVWTQAAREAVVAQRRLQNEVFTNFEVTSLRVEQLVRASNGEGVNSADRPGQTAVLQAHNQLLGTLSHETHNVIALRAARLRAEHERHAQTQTANAFHRARRESVMTDWPTKTAR